MFYLGFSSPRDSTLKLHGVSGDDLHDEEEDGGAALHELPPLNPEMSTGQRLFGQLWTGEESKTQLEGLCSLNIFQHGGLYEEERRKSSQLTLQMRCQPLQITNHKSQKYQEGNETGTQCALEQMAEKASSLMNLLKTRRVVNDRCAKHQ